MSSTNDYISSDPCNAGYSRGYDDGYDDGFKDAYNEIVANGIAENNSSTNPTTDSTTDYEAQHGNAVFGSSSTPTSAADFAGSDHYNSRPSASRSNNTSNLGQYAYSSVHHARDMPSSQAGAVKSSDKPCSIAARGTNAEGNRWSTRDRGANSGSQRSYHYSNRDGSYFYSNLNGSTCYNDGHGTTKYTPPPPPEKRASTTRNTRTGGQESASKVKTENMPR